MATVTSKSAPKTANVSTANVSPERLAELREEMKAQGTPAQKSEGREQIWKRDTNWTLMRRSLDAGLVPLSIDDFAAKQTDLTADGKMPSPEQVIARLEYQARDYHKTTGKAPLVYLFGHKFGESKKISKEAKASNFDNFVASNPAYAAIAASVGFEL